MPRQHGYQPPYDLYQVSALVFFFGLAACCYALQLPVVQDEGAKAALAVIYTLVVAASLVLHAVCRCVLRAACAPPPTCGNA